MVESQEDMRDTPLIDRLVMREFVSGQFSGYHLAIRPACVQSAGLFTFS